MGGFRRFLDESDDTWRITESNMRFGFSTTLSTTRGNLVIEKISSGYRVHYFDGLTKKNTDCDNLAEACAWVYTHTDYKINENLRRVFEGIE